LCSEGLALDEVHQSGNFNKAIQSLFGADFFTNAILLTHLLDLSLCFGVIL
jgi:hypothetical protein